MLHTVILYVYVISHENFNSVAEFYRRKILKDSIFLFMNIVFCVREQNFSRIIIFAYAQKANVDIEEKSVLN